MIASDRYVAKTLIDALQCDGRLQLLRRFVSGGRSWCMYHVHVISDDERVQRIFGKSSSNQDVRYISIKNENLNSYLPAIAGLVFLLAPLGAPVVVVFLDRSKTSQII